MAQEDRWTDGWMRTSVCGTGRSKSAANVCPNLPRMYNYFRDEISDNFDDLNSSGLASTLNSSGLASTMDSSDAAPESSFV